MATVLVGVVAQYNGKCAECAKMIIKGKHLIIQRGSGWLHVECQKKPLYYDA